MILFIWDSVTQQIVTGFVRICTEYKTGPSEDSYKKKVVPIDVAFWEVSVKGRFTYRKVISHIVNGFDSIILPKIGKLMNNIMIILNN